MRFNPVSRDRSGCGSYGHHSEISLLSCCDVQLIASPMLMSPISVQGAGACRLKTEMSPPPPPPPQSPLLGKNLTECSHGAWQDAAGVLRRKGQSRNVARTAREGFRPIQPDRCGHNPIHIAGTSAHTTHRVSFEAVQAPAFASRGTFWPRRLRSKSEGRALKSARSAWRQI